MTLLELTVALTLGGTAVAIGVAAYSAVTDRRDALLTAADGDLRALTARRELERWVASARTGAGADGVFAAYHRVVRSASGDIADDSLAFLTRADGEWRRVSLFIDRRIAPPALVADISGGAGHPRRVVLAGDVAGLEVQCLTAALGERQWQREWNGTYLPNALRLRVQAAPGSATPVPLQGTLTISLANAQ
jgi:hypothetical protein